MKLSWKNYFFLDFPSLPTLGKHQQDKKAFLQRHGTKIENPSANDKGILLFVNE